MRPFPAAALALSIAGLSVPAHTQPSQDPAAVLAAARAALGGDALLNNITSLTVSGSITENPGPITIGRSVEFSLQLPDKFLMMRRHTVLGPPRVTGMDFTVTDYHGFNGDVPLDAVIAPRGPVPMIIRAPKTPEEIQAVTEARLRLQKHIYARFMLPLFAASPAAAAFEFESAGQVTVDKVLADVITATAVDGTTLQLFFDAATHLPLKLTWMDAPIVISQGPPIAPPTPDQLAPVEWTVAFADYKTDAGLTWPHKFVTSYGGKKREEMRLGKYKINVPIKPQVFEPRR